MPITVTGIADITRNLDKTNRAFATAVEGGLKKAGLRLQRESQLIVPVDTTALKSSAFTRAEGSGFDTAISVGYTQDYGIFVHEDLNARHEPGKQAKFLEEPALRLVAVLRQIVQDELNKVR